MGSALRREVQPVVPYREAWPEAYRREAELIKRVLQDELLYIEHVGSTAIVGCGGRPMIDLLAIMQDLKRVDFYTAGLKGAGYEEIVPAPIPTSRFFVKDICGEDMRWRRTAHLYLFPEDHPRMRVMLNNRDYLLANPAEARQFEEFNRTLVQRHGNNYESYLEKKKDYFEDLSDRSAKWRRQG